MSLNIDPETLSLADALALVSLLAVGDRSKMPPAQILAYANALSAVLHEAALVASLPVEAPLVPGLRAAALRGEP